MTVTLIMLILLGLCFGDFLTAFVERLHDGRDWVKGHSECESCHHRLNYLDMLPVVGWLLVGGKCRYCKKPIARHYPLIEIATAALFVLSYVAWPHGFKAAGLTQFVVWLVVIIGAMALIVYDLRWMILPNKILYPLIVLAIIGVVAQATVFHGGANTIREAVLGIVAAGGVFFVLFQLSAGRWIGGGDVKLGILIGLLIGGPLKSLLVIFIASILGTVVALPLLATKRLKRNSHMPFGPFLLMGMVVVMLYGQQIVDWYLRSFGL